MKKLTVTSSVLPLALFSAVFALPSYAAETDCQPMSEQTRLNHMRMMGMSYLNGPVKSSSMVTTAEQQDSDTQLFSASNITLSPCGQITHYDFTRRSMQYGMIFDLLLTGAETAGDISMEYRFSADYAGKKKTRPTISRIFLLKDAQQVITGYRTENFIEGNSTIMTENGTVEYRDNNIHSVLINSEILAKSYSLNFDYDNAGRVTRIYTTPIPLSDFNFTYNEKGGLDKGTERTESTGIVTGNDIQCTEWDTYQNCTAGVWLRHINGEPAGEVPFRTTYEYYGDK
ncbi:hypothetical protein CKG00_05060 [Morganella morganii]|uniref:YD repeat-containing protein n=1 Tax=Morganella morganii TaxID=582 RepID=A0A433ZUL2_MORMO|nr:hypothetical protein [Morganella morganii]RUT65834.1 hypothetical protein CKG00_05060 [Morganella morganii]